MFIDKREFMFFGDNLFLFDLKDECVIRFVQCVCTTYKWLLFLIEYSNTIKLVGIDDKCNKAVAGMHTLYSKRNRFNSLRLGRSW